MKNPNRNILKSLALDDQEIDIYLYIARNPYCYATEIINTLNLEKSAVYKYLGRLVEKGIVESSADMRNRRYFVGGREKILDLQRAKVQREEKTLAQLEDFVAEIDDYAKEKYKQENIRVYEGAAGYKAWMYNRLEGSHKLVRELGARAFLEELASDYYEFMDEFIPRRIERGVYVNSILIDKSEIPDHLDRTSADMLKEVRQFKGEFAMGAYVTVYGANTAFYSKKDDKFLGIIIEDRFIAAMVDSLYEILWQQSEVVD